MKEMIVTRSVDEWVAVECHREGIEKSHDGVGCGGGEGLGVTGGASSVTGRGWIVAGEQQDVNIVLEEVNGRDLNHTGPLTHCCTAAVTQGHIVGV